MSVLAKTDTVAANQPVTITWTGVIAPWTTPNAVKQGIVNAFANAEFRVTDVQLPVLASPVVQGSFVDWDGAGHSSNGRNLLESEVETFFLSVMDSVPGLFLVGVESVQAGSVNAGLGNTLGGGGVFGDVNWTKVVVVAVVVLLLVVIVWTATKEIV